LIPLIYGDISSAFPIYPPISPQRRPIQKVGDCAKIRQRQVLPAVRA
jgi:hypothetical protein